MKKKVLIIIPAYNEAKAIEGTVANVRESLAKVDAYDFSILVIDDCSTDDTFKVANKIEGIIVVSLPLNIGIGGAVQTGYLYAHRNGFDVGIQVDGDGQHDADDIVKLLECMDETNADIIVGSRFIKKTGYKPPLARRIGMKYSEGILNAFTKRRIKDTTSGFRAVNSRLLEFFASNYPTMFAGVIPLAMAHLNGFTSHEMRANFHYRQHGKSSINIKKSIFYPLQISLAILGVWLRSMGRRSKS